MPCISRATGTIARVPAINTDKDQTLASMQRIADIMAKEKAQLWINHDKAQRDSLKMAPDLLRVRPAGLQMS